jgi:hypothetical protein
MKIISWNLLNLSTVGLAKDLTLHFTHFGLGNNVLDYITKLVMADAAWNNLGMSDNPADIFVIIELKTGGETKGAPVEGNCLPTLTTLTTALNTIANARGIAANYQYAYATPLITGKNEAVGIIFNTRVFNAAPATQTLRTNNNQNLQKHTPFMATLVRTADNRPFKIIGIHAPPLGLGGVNRQYKPPIDFVIKLGSITELDPTLPANSNAEHFIMGDFNCNPASMYIKGDGTHIFGFTFLRNDWHYATNIPDNTLSSLRTAVVPGGVPPANYLSMAYDNLLYKFAGAAPVVNERVLDLIANARDMTVAPPAALYPAELGGEDGLLRNSNIVSNHLPVIMEF